MKEITPFLWFDSNAEEAVRFYVSIFENSKIGRISHYTEAGKENHEREPGSPMVIEFELNFQKFNAINGGPHFKFNESVSFVLNCTSQEEIDYYWEKLSEGGDPKAQQCGWLKDKFGLSWQVIPDIISELMMDPTRAENVMSAIMKMKKIDIATLQAA